MALEIVVLHLDEWIKLLLFYILDGSGATIVMSLVIALDTIGENLTELVALYTTSTSFCCATLKNPFFIVSVRGKLMKPEQIQPHHSQNGAKRGYSASIVADKSRVENVPART
jgi:hypothetical protein